MKKYFCLVILLLAFFPSLVLAQTYSQDDIEKGSYIIGNYLFNKNKNAIYDGTLTTPMIMLASKSIDSDNLNTMIIYYKNSRGRWVNAITGQALDIVPNNFEITCINLDCVNNSTATNFGYDTYSNSNVSNGVYLIGKYLFNKEQNDIYDGTLTTPMIMLASKSIESNNLNDMIIYYKNSRGKWVNAITGQLLDTIPNNFNVGIINLKPIGNPQHPLEKKDSSLTLSESSGTTTYGVNKNITITKVGDGNLTCISSDENVATCSINNDTLIIEPKAYNSDSSIILTVILSEGEEYKGNTAIYTLTVNRFLLTCPSSPIDKEFNNSLQQSGITCPEGSIAGGTEYAINAGTHNQTCTADNGYKFENTCSIDWKINKADSSLTLSKTSGSTTYGVNKNITITKVGDGNLTCLSSDEDVATCSISNNTLTVIPQAITEDNKETTITVNLSEGENYKETSTTYTLTVNRILLTCPSSPLDKVFNNTLQHSGITCPEGSIVGGTKYTINAGTHNQTCTADNGYKFENTCSIDWKINKADSNLTLSETSGSTTYGVNKNITITKVGDGNLTCISSDEDVATCSISNNTLIVTSQKISEDSKSTTITLNIDATENYNSTGTTYTITINRIDYNASSVSDIDPTKWVATDKLGRTIAVNGDTDPYKGSISSLGAHGTKKVGIFYWDWHLPLQDTDTTYTEYSLAARQQNKYPYNISELVAANPSATNDYNHSIWSTNNSKYYWWNEPIYGYYTEADDYVIRRHAELLADAGIDFIVLDCTNGRFLWEKSYENIFRVFQMAKNDGINVPKIVFMLNFDGSSDDYAYQINTLYNKIYKNNLYKDLWFMMDGDNKPLILGGKPTNKNITSAVYSTFTFRTSVPEYTRTGPQQFTNEIKWGWLSTSNQAYYLDLDGNIEQSTVGVAQNFNASSKTLSAMNGSNIMGRSYSPGYTYSYKYRNQTITIGDHPQGTFYGRNFEHQWEYVRQIDPNYVFVTGWNEWIVGREESWQGVNNAFPDQFNDEYSRDIEPSKGSLKDNYYYQLVSNVRKYKGANNQECQLTPNTIDIYGSPEQWSNNNFISYNSYTNKTAPTRNSKEWGYNNTNYLTNNTFRNDIRTAKVSYDENNLYFYVETEDKINNYKNSFRLLLDTIDSVNNTSTNNWNEFEYVINRTGANDDTFTLEKSLGNNNWETVGRVEYNIVTNTIQIIVPLSLVNLNVSNLNFNFKWADNNMNNMTNVDDIMSVYTDGDTAPGGRFAFKFCNK